MGRLGDGQRMHAQRADARVILARARSLGRRTIVGGPWASNEPDAVLADADHVFVGESEEAFAGIAAALEHGSAQRLYRASDKPEMTLSPVPRYDLLRLDKYASMSVQYSRGCPFQCDFCNIITIYGRRPRVKTSAQLIAELDTLRRLGWRKQVFIVDDNFIGNHRQALSLARDLAAWQKRHRYPSRSTPRLRLICRTAPNCSLPWWTRTSYMSSWASKRPLPKLCWSVESTRT